MFKKKSLHKSTQRKFSLEILLNKIIKIVNNKKKVYDMKNC